MAKKIIIAVLGGILLLVVIVLLFNAGDTEAQSASKSTTYNAPSDSSAQDSLGEQNINFDRLKRLVQENSKEPVDTTNLDSQINSIINSNIDIIFGVSIKHLNTGSVHSYGNLEGMTAASVSKVLTAVDYMKQVELGHTTLDRVMADGNTAQYDIEQMIVVSDNNAWHVLNDFLGYPQIQDYAQSIGISSYDYTYNTMSAPDTTKLLGDLYERLLINDSHTQLLLSYMERANYRDLIIPAVPSHDSVYHKAGELYSNLNDTAIITNSTDTIVISIFTESTYSYSKSRVASLMQQITTPTLQTFNLN